MQVQANLPERAMVRYRRLVAVGHSLSATMCEEARLPPRPPSPMTAAAVPFAKRKGRGMRGRSLREKPSDAPSLSEDASMIQLPTSAEISYLRRFQVAAIYLAKLPSATPMVLVGSAANIAASVQALIARRRDVYVGSKPLDIVWAGWCGSAAADRVAHAVTSRHGSALLRMKVKDAMTEVQAMAARHGVMLADHQTTLSKVGAAVAKIADRVEASRTNGNMVAFNEEYKRRRKLARQTGRHFPAYGVAVARLQRHMASCAPGAAAPSRSLLEAVFGKDGD
jgi:hypothetical protein